MVSERALQLYALKRGGGVFSNAEFWARGAEILQHIDVRPYAAEWEKVDRGLLCALDEGFPRIDLALPASEKPCFFAYRGDVSLLNDVERNVAVVGVLNPSDEVVFREQHVVKKLVQNGFNIVSGLARGCDTVAHSECLVRGGKTVAFLPTTLSDVYPKENVELVEKIVEGGGLVITEYVTEPKTRQEGVGRFVARDRLQAMFSRRVLLIASYRKGEGDSGSRHAMEKAKKYGRERFVMYREEDVCDPQFGLNRQILKEGGTVLTANAIENFSKWKLFSGK